jgi:hypothetical protein
MSNAIKEKKEDQNKVLAKKASECGRRPNKRKRKSKKKNIRGISEAPLHHAKLELPSRWIEWRWHVVCERKQALSEICKNKSSSAAVAERNRRSSPEGNRGERQVPT